MQLNFFTTPDFSVSAQKTASGECQCFVLQHIDAGLATVELCQGDFAIPVARTLICKHIVAASHQYAWSDVQSAVLRLLPG